MVFNKIMINFQSPTNNNIWEKIKFYRQDLFRNSYKNEKITKKTSCYKHKNNSKGFWEASAKVIALSGMQTYMYVCIH